MVTAINAAQLRLGRDFTQAEFDSGAIGQLMIDEDFDFEKAVSLRIYRLESVVLQTLFYHELEFPNEFVIFFNFALQKEALSSDRRKQFQDELNTLSGPLKAKYDEINKEYQGILFLAAL